MNSGLYWLASYPKSGNTWTRSFLLALTSPEQEIDINELETGAIASSRCWIERGLGLSLEDNCSAEIDMLRPLAYRFLHEQCLQAQYHKVHDAYTLNQLHQPVFPVDAAMGVLYIARHPYDVAVSLANHNNYSIQQAVDAMCNRDYRLVKHGRKMNLQVEQRLLSWSEHVQSWLDSPHRLQLVRYEDMQQLPLATFSTMAEFLGITCGEPQILAALDACHFDKLQKNEQAQGFREKPVASAAFFRSGKVGEGRQQLTAGQQQQLSECHGAMMLRLNYLK